MRIPPAYRELSEAILQSLIDVDPEKKILNRMAFISFDSARQDIHIEMARAVDGAMIWGGEEAVMNVRSLPFPYWARFMVFGPRISVAMMDTGAWSSGETRKQWFTRLARDLWQFEQKACSSPQVLFIEKNPYCDEDEFLSELSTVLERENSLHPRDDIDISLASLIINARAACLIDNIQNRAVFPLNTDWSMLVHTEVHLPEPVQGKTLHCIFIDSIEDAVDLLDGNVQTIGLAMADVQKEEAIAEKAGQRGIDRVVRLGTMHVFDSPWDGYELLSPMVRKVRYSSSIENSGGVSMKGAVDFLNAIQTKAKMFYKHAKETYDNNRYTCDWMLNPLAEWAHKAYGDEVFEFAARGYAQYCYHVLQAQRKYEKNGRYTPDELPKIKEEVYDDSSYMTPYMWAAVLIYPLWASMVNHIPFFRDEFLMKLPDKSKIIEFACGHGVLGLMALEYRQDAVLTGYDISSHAIDIANNLSKAAGKDDRSVFAVKDVMSLEGLEEGNRYNGIISAMLAEHLENPVPLFISIEKHLEDDGLVYFSTAIESPQPDHIYEFHWESEPVKMAEEAGLRVIKLISESGEQAEGDRFLPRAVAMILKKR